MPEKQYKKSQANDYSFAWLYIKALPKEERLRKLDLDFDLNT